jgi:hypothetical protein
MTKAFITRGDTCVWLLDVPYPRTFMAWLRGQVDFPGRIRDLAGDVVADPDTASLRSAKALRRYLETKGAPNNVLETLAEAEIVWQVTYGAADERRRKNSKHVHYHGADAR